MQYSLLLVYNTKKLKIYCSWEKEERKVNEKQGEKMTVERDRLNYLRQERNYRRDSIWEYRNKKFTLRYN